MKNIEGKFEVVVIIIGGGVIVATYYLIRHGEADYNKLMEYRFFGFGRDLAPLSEKGILQANETAKAYIQKRQVSNGKHLWI